MHLRVELLAWAGLLSALQGLEHTTEKLPTNVPRAPGPVCRSCMWWRTPLIPALVLGKLRQADVYEFDVTLASRARSQQQEQQNETFSKNGLFGCMARDGVPPRIPQ